MIGTLGKGATLTRAGSGLTHCLASTLAGAVFGLLLAVCGSLLPHRVALDLMLGATAGYLAMQLGFIQLRLPESGRQVPASWRYRFPQPLVALIYGALLGVGVGTRIADAGMAILLIGTTLTVRVPMGALVLGFYGFVRGAVAVFLSTNNAARIHHRLTFGQRTVRLWRTLSIVESSVLLGAVAAVIVTR